MNKGNLNRQEAFFNQLYQMQYQKMLLLAAKILSNLPQADEAVQDAFLEAWIHIDKLLEQEKPELWLQKTVKNKTLHILRERARNMKWLISLDDSFGQEFIAAPDRLEHIESDGLEKTRQKIAQALTREEYTLLRRIALEQASYRIAAEEAGISIGACYKKVQRIRKKLKKCFPNR